MITKGIILGEVENSGGYKWRVCIPTLTGLPDSAEESKLFKAYQEQQDALKKLKKENKPKDALQILLNLIRARLVNQGTQNITISEEQKRFTIEAEVCGLIGTKVNYMIGDIVIVGFLDNSMSNPIILGAYQTKELAETRITKPQISAENLSVMNGTTLYNGTTFKTKNRDITTTDLYNTVQYVEGLKLRGLTFETLSAIIAFIYSLGGSTLQAIILSLLPKDEGDK